MNALASLDNPDPDPAFNYYSRVWAIEFTTQDENHLILVADSTVNGNYGKTFPGLNAVDCHLAKVGRDMILTNLSNNSTYCSFASCYN